MCAAGELDVHCSFIAEIVMESFGMIDRESYIKFKR